MLITSKINTLLETFYKKSSEFCTKKPMSVKKKKNPKKGFELVFLRRFFRFYWAGFLLPTLPSVAT
jgi:hypothetical protein